MKSLFAIQDGGLSDAASDRTARIKVLQGLISDLNAELLVQYKIIENNTHGYFTQDLASSQIRAAAVEAANQRIAQIQIQLNTYQLELNGLMTAVTTEDAIYQASPIGAVNANQKAADDFRRQMFLLGKPGYDYGIKSGSRNALFAKDSGLGFDVFGAVVASLKTNAPAAFSGVKGGEVLRSIIPNAGGSSVKLPKISLPSWLPKISVPKPLQDAAKRAADLAVKTAKDVAAKKKAADQASGVAAQTSEFVGSPTSNNNNMKWVLGGAAILALAAFVTRKK